MITRLHIENFKSWRDTGELRFAPLTGLFGANSSGKTAILQFLLMLKQTVDSPDRKQVLNFGDERDPVMLGTFPDVVFQHDRSRPIRWSIGWREEDSCEVSFEAQVSERRDGLLHTESFQYLMEKGKGLRRLEGGKYEDMEGDISGALRRSNEGGYEVVLRNAAQPDSPAEVIASRKGPVKFYGFPSDVPGPFDAFELDFEGNLGKLSYLGPLREYPKRDYTWSGGRPTGVGRRGERAVDALLAARLNGTTLSAEQHVARWLQKLGLIHEFRVAEIAPESRLYRVLVRRSKASPEVLLTDVGFGVSQILPVLVLCFYAPEGSILILEQPEIHLHPSVQAGLADVLIDAIQGRGIQILLESHSEYLLNRLQRRIAEDNGFTQDDVALYFCSNEDGESRATPLEVDPFGNITNWPRDFFGDEMGDLAARTRAEMERRKAKAG